MNYSSIQHSSITLGSAFICPKFLIFSISHFLIFSRFLSVTWSLSRSICQLKPLSSVT